MTALLRVVIFFILFVFLYFPISAQEVVWASKVLEKSSETTDPSFSPKHRAVQILGPPSILPLTGPSACSWRPTGMSFGEDYIKVGFAKPTKVRQIIVGETVGAGAIGRIFGYTKDNKEVLLYQNSGDNTKRKAGIWNQLIPETSEEIVAVKLLIVHSLNKGIKEYDCIGISGSSEPYVAKINLADNLPPDIERISLGPNINSKFSEVAPLVSPDGKHLYFTRLNHPKNYYAKSGKKGQEEEGKNLDVWVSNLDAKGNWSLAANMSKPIHEGSKNAAATVSMDGKNVFVLNVKLPNGDYTPGLSRVSLKNNQWTGLKQVKIADFRADRYFDATENSYKLETEFSMSTDEKFLVMGLVGSTSYGDKDLYVSFKTGENSYSKPLNLGSILNTAGNEGSPFLAADNKTLYFNSNGHPGYGNMDIFMTTRLDDTWTNWTTPINLGPQINSAEFDGYISIPASGEYAYFSSAKNSVGLDDLFKIKLFPEIQPEAVVMYEFKFVGNDNKKELRPTIAFKNLTTSDTKAKDIDFIYDDESQSYKCVLPVGFKYELTAKEFGYINLIVNLDYIKETKYQEVITTHTMQLEIVPEPVLVKEEEQATPKETPIAEAKVTTGEPSGGIANLKLEAGSKLVLNEVYFDQSVAVLRQESFVELDRIRKIMTENPTMEILLEGHTDNQGDASLNLKLGRDRIAAVKDYITKDGLIGIERISIKSWGPYRPLLKNSSEGARKKNRRVEFTILKM